MTIRRDIKFQNITQFLLWLAIIIIVNIIAGYIFTRFDLTDDGRYSISEPTRKLVEEIEDPILFKVYLDGDLPSNFKRLKKETQEMLMEFNAYNKNVLYEFIDPNENPNREQRNKLHQQLWNKGLTPRNITIREKGKASAQVVFPGAIVSYRGREVPMHIFQNQLGKPEQVLINNSVQQLEYTIASTIKILTTEKRMSVAFTRGHGELWGYDIAGAVTALNNFYEIDQVKIDGRGHRLFEVDSKDSTSLVIKYDALIIAKPDSFFQKVEQFMLDQYIMHGGKVLWLIDPIWASLDSLQDTNATLGRRLNLNLSEQLFTYGVRLNSDLIRDMKSLYLPLNTQPGGTQPKFELFPWPFSPIVGPKGDHPIVKNLNDVKTEFISSLDTVDTEGIDKTILLTTGKYSKRNRSPIPIDIRLLMEEPNQKLYNESNVPVAVLLEGKFSSFFKNRFSPDKENEMLALEESKPTKMIVVSDGDIIKNQFRKSESGSLIPFPLGYDRYMDMMFGNEDFILNAVNYLLDDSGLLEARTKEFDIRPLDSQKINDKKIVLKWRIINVVAPILLILILGVVIIILKRRKYSLKK